MIRLLLLLPAFFVGVAAGQPDELRARWLEGRPAVTDWEPLRGERGLLSLAPRSRLRMVGEGPFGLALSADGALFVEWSPRLAADGGSWLAEAPFEGAWLARPSHPEGAPPACFASRLEAPGEIAPYLDSLPLEGDSIGLAVGAREALQRYHRLTPRGERTLTVSGPLRLALESRRLYGEAERRAAADYRIFVTVDGEPHGVLPFEATPERRRTARLDGRAALVGVARRGYLELPEGRHRLSLAATAEVAARLLACMAGPAEATHLASSWTTPPETPDLSHPAAVEALARRLARDTAHRDGGLAARALVGRLAAAHPPQPELADLPAGGGTRFEALPPVGPVSGRTARFVTRRLLAPGEARRLVVGEGLLEEQRGLSRAAFAELSAEPLRFALPADPFPRRLRVVALRGERPTTFRLARDGGPELRFTLQPEPVVATERFQYDTALAALEASGLAGTPLLDPADPDPAPLAAVGWLELPLPAGEGPLRLWGEGAVALQLERSADYRLDEAEYLDLIGRLDGAPFERFVTLLGEDGRFAVQVGAFLEEHQARRLLVRLRGEGFGGEIRHRPLGGGRTLYRVVAAPFGGKGAAREAAAALRALGHPTLLVEGAPAVEAPAGWDPADEAAAALENQWRPLVRLLRARHRRFSATVAGGEPLPLAPRLTTAEAARLAGEARRALADGRPLAAVERWGRLAQGGRGAVREAALSGLAEGLAGAGERFLAERLLRALALRGDPLARERLLAGADETERETLLSAAFVADPTVEGAIRLAEGLAGEGRWWSALRLALLLPQARRPRTVLLSAALALGWSRLFERWVGGEDEALWRGHRAARDGDYVRALGHYRAAGASDWETALEEALALRERLADADPVHRREALSGWAEALQRWPGGRVWRPLEGAVVASAGGARLVNPLLDRATPVQRAEPGRPLRLALIGPARLRLALRPLHRSTGEEALDGWFALSVDGASRRLPFTANLPSEGLLVEGGGGVPGEALSEELELGPGLHRIELAAERVPLLARLSRALPALATHPLPPVTPALVAEAARRPLVERAPPEGPPFSPRRWVTLDGEARMLPEAEPPPPPLADPAIDYPSGVAGQSPATPRARMAELLAEVETSPGRPGPRVAAEALAAAHPDDPPLRRLHRRITAGARWEPVSDLEGGAGVSGIEIEGWGAESPALRARAALLAPPAAGERLLAVGTRAELELFAPLAERLRLELAVDRVRFLPGGPLTVSYRLDGAESRRLTLSPDAPRRSLELALTPGGHSLAVAVERGPANHYLRLRAVGDEAPPPRIRHYRVATPEQPLYAHLEGPAWLRVDQLRDGETLSHTLAVAPGWQRIGFAPAEGEQWLRLFRRVHDGEGAEEERIRLRAGSAAEAPPPATLAGEPPRVEAPLDGFPHSSAATWSYGALWADLKGGDEEEGGDDDRFLEFSAERRQLRPWPGDWLRAGGLLRLRERGEPTLGARAEWRTPLDRLDLDLTLRGTLYGQSVAGRWGWSGRLAATLGRAIALSPRDRHLPSVTLFARALTLDGAAAGEVVDRDVWSRYKDRHRNGLLLEETLIHRATTDREWYGGVRLATNQGLDGWDHLRLRAGLRQRLGRWRLEGEWRQLRYFADGDRAAAADRPALDLRLAREGWRDRYGRWELGLRWRADLDSGDHSALFSIQWHDGPGYRDFAPGEIDFRAAREWSRPATLPEEAE